MSKSRVFISTMVIATLLLLILSACQNEPPPAPPTPTPGPDVDAVKREVVANYAEGVHALYSKSLASATIMDQAIDTFPE